ncbi:hypothetical protein HYR54_05450 [Candidatus Acetothermia bacterium]|nr:hypothetical protein [Candidatus Acetothermia bacterium]
MILNKRTDFSRSQVTVGREVLEKRSRVRSKLMHTIGFMFALMVGLVCTFSSPAFSQDLCFSYNQGEAQGYINGLSLSDQSNFYAYIGCTADFLQGYQDGFGYAYMQLLVIAQGASNSTPLPSAIFNRVMDSFNNFGHNTLLMFYNNQVTMNDVYTDWSLALNGFVPLSETSARGGKSSRFSNQSLHTAQAVGRLRVKAEAFPGVVDGQWVLKKAVQPSDPIALSLVMLEGDPQGHRVQWEFTDPNGQPYYQADIPSTDQGVWAYINVNGHRAAELVGKWTVKFYIDGKLQFTDFFVIGDISGDVNGDGQVDKSDLRRLDQAISGKKPLSALEFARADVSQRCGANAARELQRDRQMIARFLMINKHRSIKDQCHGVSIGQFFRIDTTTTSMMKLQSTGSPKQQHEGVRSEVIRPSSLDSLLLASALTTSRVQLQVFNLDGTLRYSSGWVDRSALNTTEAELERGLANGVYSILVAVQNPDGTVVRREQRKLAILR